MLRYPVCNNGPLQTFSQEKQSDSPNWIFYVNNNPLVAPASHPVVRLALARSTRILLSHEEKRLDIQSTTGPGNLTASLVNHVITGVITAELAGQERDFSLLANWETISISRWPLSYRDDERNWRLLESRTSEYTAVIADLCVPVFGSGPNLNLYPSLRCLATKSNCHFE